MRISAAGEATPEEAWRRYVTPHVWPTWAPQLRKVSCKDRTLRPGSSGTVHGPLLLRVPFQVLDVDDVQRRWWWRVGWPTAITTEHGIDAGEQGGAVAWVDLPPMLLGYAPLAQLALRRLVRP